jgi:hypothetical protein
MFSSCCDKEPATAFTIFADLPNLRKWALLGNAGAQAFLMDK